ncbi:uncharacterized protein LOC129230359 [Uloborus diversus]|uniref:uncharacterized protein LOC129230359 n=1 Tax=Uloborus diversus TaxID=327109 RepID=UPI00240A7E97|nr:uncharacterized protein LOC129230359 [Uloborus diversus]
MSSNIASPPKKERERKKNFHGHYGRSSPGSYFERDPLLSDLSRVYTYSYLAAEPTQGYLRRPIEPRPPKSPQFHRPPDCPDKRRTWSKSPSHKHGMQALVDSIQSTTPRPRSPHMNNEEPIEYSHYPGGKPPPPEEMAPIERDDFPAPPFPFTDPERRRRWSGSSKGVEVEDEPDMPEEINEVDPQLKREEEELSKIATGIGKVFLKTVKDREKIKAWKRSHLDPRNASRTPSASKEPPVRLRYDNPVNASPSRDSDHPRPWEEEEFERKSSFRSSTGRLVGTIPSYNVVSSLRNVPKPGYGLASRSPGPMTGRDSGLGYISDLTFGGLEKTHSSEFSSGKSDKITEPDIIASLYLNHIPIFKLGKIAISVRIQMFELQNRSGSGLFRGTPYSEGFRGFRYPTYSPHLRHSLPNVTLHLSTEPPKLYPYHLLITSNYRVPADVDRCHLERHLSNEEFQALFHLTRLQFYRLPEWRRNDLKRRARLF